MKKLGFENPNPIKHDWLNSSKEVAETFAYYFEEGKAIEIFVGNKTIFDLLVKEARKLVHEEVMGGNAAIMAEAAFREGAEILLGCEISSS